MYQALRLERIHVPDGDTAEDGPSSDLPLNRTVPDSELAGYTELTGPTRCARTVLGARWRCYTCVFKDITLLFRRIGG